MSAHATATPSALDELNLPTEASAYPLSPIQPAFANRPKLRAVSFDELLTWGACWSPRRMRDLAHEHGGGAATWTALDALRLLRGVVSDSDLVWLLTQRGWYEHPTPVLFTLRADFAQGALEAERERGREPDASSWRAVEVARRFAVGEAGEGHLSAAWSSAAWSAAWSAAIDRITVVLGASS